MDTEGTVGDKLQRLIEEIKKARWENCDPEHMARRAERQINELRQGGVYYVERFLQKLLDRVGDKDAYLDILMQGRFATILDRNGFREIHIEYADAGPDIKAEYNGQRIFFEVTRKHPKEDEWMEGIASSGRVENIIAIIREKLRQLQLGELNIVVLWSDTVSLGEREFKEAFDYIIQENQVTGAFGDLSGVLLTESGGVDTATMKQFYLFKNDNASKPICSDLGNILESLLERDRQILQKENEDLTAALQKLKANRRGLLS